MANLPCNVAKLLTFDAARRTLRPKLPRVSSSRWRIPDRARQGPANEPNKPALRKPRRFAQTGGHYPVPIPTQRSTMTAFYVPLTAASAPRKSTTGRSYRLRDFRRIVQPGESRWFEIVSTPTSQSRHLKVVVRAGSNLLEYASCRTASRCHTPATAPAHSFSFFRG
jgi:hypothetical protein